MFAMNMNSVSILYGSPAQALRITCVHHAVGRERRFPGEGLVEPPRRAVGLDQQILAATSGSRAAGRASACRAVTSAARPVGLIAGRRGPRKRRLVAEAARANRSAPSSICRTWIARQVWKPLEWAEMPRMACMATGRPTILSWRRPAQSVQGWSITIGLLEGGMRRVRRRCAGSTRRRCRSRRRPHRPRIAARGSAWRRDGRRAPRRARRPGRPCRSAAA